MENQLIKLARQAIETEFSKKEVSIPLELQDALVEKRGVFVTIYKNKKLRGCIGFPEPILPLGIALIKAAKSAAFEDPRFHPIDESELKYIKIEITLLTKPKKTSLKNIKVGRDGLIVKKDGASGLLLPQVWEQIPDKKEFLKALCTKAGLPSDSWEKDSSVELYKFHGEIIREG